MNLRVSLVVDDDLNTPTAMVSIVGDVDVEDEVFKILCDCGRLKVEQVEKEALGMEDLKIKKGCGSLACENRLHEIVINIYGQHSGWTILSKKEAEKFKDWLEEALKEPRFVIVERCEFGVCYVGYEVKDTKTGGRIAMFFTKGTNYDAKKEAERLCERLNKEC